MNHQLNDDAPRARRHLARALSAVVVALTLIPSFSPGATAVITPIELPKEIDCGDHAECNLPGPDDLPKCPELACENPCLNSISMQQAAAGSSPCIGSPPSCPDFVCQNECTQGVLPGGSMSPSGPGVPDEACGVPVPQPGPVGPVEPNPPTLECVLPRVCDYCYPSAFHQAFQEEGRKSCEPPKAEPCMDDPARCVLKDLWDTAQGGCNDLTYLGPLAAGTGSKAELYAKRVLVDTGSSPSPGGFQASASGFRYDIFAAWEMTGVTITVGADQYPIGFALEWGQNYAIHSTWGNQSRKDGICEHIGRIEGTEFKASVHGGAAGVAGSSSCSWEVSASYSLAVGVEVDIGPKPGASTTVTHTVTLGGSTGCTDGSLFDSEVLMQNAHESFAIPPWTT